MDSFLTEFFGSPIHSYSRSQAIKDGVLRDVTDLAREYGILLPTAIAHNAWNEAVAWPDATTASEYEPERARTVLAHAASALREAKRLGLEGLQEFSFLPVPEKETDGSRVLLGIEVGPGDAAEPVLTITAASDR